MSDSGVASPYAVDPLIPPRISSPRGSGSSKGSMRAILLCSRDRVLYPGGRTNRGEEQWLLHAMGLTLVVRALPRGRKRPAARLATVALAGGSTRPTTLATPPA